MILPRENKVEKLHKMGHVTLGQEDHRQDLQSFKEILRDTCQIFQHQLSHFLIAHPLSLFPSFFNHPY